MSGNSRTTLDSISAMTNSSLKLVSVVIPTYNRAHFIVDAIESVLNQSYPSIEILIIDDGSTDDTDKVLENYNDKITLIKQANQGVSSARNNGISHANGDYVAFLDSDDIWAEDKITKQINIFNEYPRTGLVTGGWFFINSKGEVVGSQNAENTFISKEYIEIYNACGSPSNCLIKKSVLDEVGHFDVNLSCSEDRELFMRIAQISELRSVLEPTVYMRMHDEFRPNRDVGKIIRDRKIINRGIASRKIKKKADAWMFFFVFERFCATNKYRAIPYAILSFFNYPFSILPNKRRLVPFLDVYMPDYLTNKLSILKKYILKTLKK